MNRFDRFGLQQSCLNPDFALLLAEEAASTQAALLPDEAASELAQAIALAAGVAIDQATGGSKRLPHSIGEARLEFAALQLALQQARASLQGLKDPKGPDWDKVIKEIINKAKALRKMALQQNLWVNLGSGRSPSV